MVKINILQITNDNWCYGFLHCNLTHFILDPLMSADLHHVYPATFQPHRSAVPATGGQAPGDDWTIPFQGRKRKGIRIDTWQPQARKNKQQAAKSSSDEASQCYSTKVILLQVSIPSILGIKTWSKDFWVVHGLVLPFTTQHRLLLTKLRNTLVMRSFCAPFVSPPISLVWEVSEYPTLLQLRMGMSWGFNDGVQLHQRLATVMGTP